MIIKPSQVDKKMEHGQDNLQKIAEKLRKTSRQSYLEEVQSERLPSEFL